MSYLGRERVCVVDSLRKPSCFRAAWALLHLLPGPLGIVSEIFSALAPGLTSVLSFPSLTPSADISLLPALRLSLSHVGNVQKDLLYGKKKG